MRQLTKIFIGSAILITLMCLGGVVYLNHTTNHVAAVTQSHEQTQKLKQIRQQTQQLAATKRPKVTTATNIVTHFSNVMLNYTDQQDFDARAHKAQKYATSQVITASQMFTPDTVKLVQQLHQTSTVDQVQFFPNQVTQNQVSGRLLVTNTATQKGTAGIKQGQRRTGYAVTVDILTRKIIHITNLKTFNVQTDSDVVAQN